MEKPSEKIDAFTRKLVKEAGVSQPSFDFKNRVMEALELKKQAQKVYHPLLSKKVMVIVLLGIIACVAILYFMPSENETFVERLGVKEPVRISLPELAISKTFTYAIGCLALFLVQIPFLKKYLDRQYR